MVTLKSKKHEKNIADFVKKVCFAYIGVEIKRNLEMLQEREPIYICNINFMEKDKRFLNIK